MAHIGNAPFGKTVRTVTSETLTSVKTAYYPTGGYIVGYVDVYVNGVRLTEAADFTATDGTTVTLLYNPSIGDTVDVVTYGSIELANAVRRDGDTLVGTLYTRALVPTANVTYDIGTSTMRYRDLFLSGNTINLGDIQLTANSTSFRVSNTTGGTFPSSLANTTITGTLTSNATTITGNVSVTGNTTLTGTLTTNAHIMIGDLTVTGNQFVNGAVAFANSTSNAVFVAANGNVGFSTSTPGSRLSISGPTTGSLPIVDIVATGNNTFMRGVRMLNSGMGPNSQLMYATGQSDSSRNMGQMYFTYNSTNSVTNRLSLGLHSVDDLFNLTGNATVGIGTITPVAKLHVEGTAHITDTLSFSSSNFAVRRGVGGEWILGGDANNISFGTQAGTGPTLTLAGAGQGRIHINGNKEVILGSTQTDNISTDFVNTMGDVNRGILASNSGRWARFAIQERAGNWISFLNGSAGHYGTISLSGSGVSYGSNSDYRLKENIVPLLNGIEAVKNLLPKKFNFIGQEETVDGFLAHEVQAVAPYAVTGAKDEVETIGDVVDSNNQKTHSGIKCPEVLEDGCTFVETSTTEKYQQLDPAKLVPLLTQALKEAIEKIEALEQRVEVLESN